MASSDLIPQNVSLNSSSVTAGGSLGINWTMHNNGPGLATASTTGIRITNSPFNHGGPSDTITNISTPQLTSGGSDFESTTINVPSSLSPGTYYVWVVADNSSPGTANQGSNTGNDYQVSGSFQVTAPVSSISDLVPQNVNVLSQRPGGEIMSSESPLLYPELSVHVKYPAAEKVSKNLREGFAFRVVIKVCLEDILDVGWVGRHHGSPGSQAVNDHCPTSGLPSVRIRSPRAPGKSSGRTGDGEGLAHSARMRMPAEPVWNATGEEAFADCCRPRRTL